MNVLPTIKGISLLLLLVFFGAMKSRGQEGIDSIPPESIPLLEIGESAQQLASIVAKLKSKVRVKEEIESLQKKLDTLQPEIDSLVIFTDYFLEFEIEQSRVNDIKNKWKRVKSEVSSISNEVKNHSRVIEDEISILTEKKVVWQRTKDLPRDVPLSDLIVFQIDSSILMLNLAILNLNDSLTALISFESNIRKTGTLIQNNLDKLLEFQEFFLKRLFEKSTEALWEKDTTTDSLSSKFLRSSEITSVNFNESKAYLKNRVDSLSWFIIVSLFLFFLIKRSEKKDLLLKDGNLSFQGLHAVNEHPFVSIFIIAFSLSFLVFLPNRPEALGNAFFMIIVFSAMILRKFFFKKWFWQTLPLGLMISLGIGFIVRLWVIDPFSKRLWFLALSLASLIWTSWVYIKSRQKEPDPDGNIAFFLSIFGIGIFLALIFNIFGYIRMALFLQRAIISIYFVVLILIFLIGLLGGFSHHAFKIPLARKSRVIEEHGKQLRKSLYAIFSLFGIYIGARGVLNLLGLWDLIQTGMSELIQKEWQVGTSKLSIYSVLVFFAILLGGILISNIVKVFLEKEVLGRLNLKKGISLASSLVVKYTLVVIAFFFAIGATGINLDKIGFIAGALGVGIGFGLQNVVANFISGLILVFERPINKGDIVTVGNLMGRVLEVGIRASRIRSFQGAEVVVPNNDFVAKEVINWTLSDTVRRVELHIPIAFDNNPEKVAKVIEDSAAQLEIILNNPPPKALFVGYEHGVLNFKVLIWTNGDVFDAESLGGMAIHTGLEKAGIKVDKPNMNISLTEKGKKS